VHLTGDIIEPPRPVRRRLGGTADLPISQRWVNRSQPVRRSRERQPLLLWKSDDNSLGAGHPTHIWGQQLTARGTSLSPGTSPSLLLTESAPWQSPSAEGPTILFHGGRYYLFYGANNYDTASSGIGFAKSTSLLGSYVNKSTLGPWIGTKGNAQGAQGPNVFTDASGVTRMAFAAWYGTVGYENGGVRSLWIGTLDFTGSGQPSLK